MTRSHLLSGGRYPVLRSLAILYLLGGVLTIVAGLMLAGWALFGTHQMATDRLILLGAVAAGTFFVCITMFAVAEIIKLMIDIEHNTRSTNAKVEVPGEMRVEGEMRTGRMTKWMEGEETAEGALLRGR